MKRTLFILLSLALPIATFAQDADTSAKFSQLATDFKKVKKSAQWENIKKRRDIVLALSDLDHEGVVPILYEVFSKDREQICRIPAMVGLGKRGNFNAVKAMTTLAVREKNDVYVMCLPLAYEHVEDDRIGPWILKNLLTKRIGPDLQAAGVDYRELPVLPRDIGKDTVAGCPGKVLHDRNPLPRQTVKQGRLTYVLPSDNCYNWFSQTHSRYI